MCFEYFKPEIILRIPFETELIDAPHCGTVSTFDCNQIKTVLAAHRKPFSKSLKHDEEHHHVMMEAIMRCLATADGVFFFNFQIGKGSSQIIKG